VRLSLIVLKVEVKEEIYELLISGRKCALREIGAQIKLYVLQWTSGHLAKRLCSHDQRSSLLRLAQTPRYAAYTYAGVSYFPVPRSAIGPACVSIPLVNPETPIIVRKTLISRVKH